MKIFLVSLVVSLAGKTLSASDFSLKGDPCSKSDLCGSKALPKSCSCDADCALYGTCCQDAGAAADAPSFRCYERGMSGRPVFARRACSGDFGGHEADELACFTDDEDEMDVARNLPVTSGRTKVVYWNRHCARCSNEVDSDLELWNIEVRCPKRPGIDASLIRRNLTFHPQQKEWGMQMDTAFHPCLLRFSPPSFVDQVKHCTPNLQSRCPDNYTDEGVAKKCSQYYGERKSKHSNVLYKNIHCAICSGESVQDLECPGMSHGDPPVRDDDRAFGDTVEVIFYGGDWLEREPGKEFECSKGFSYDPARQKCRRYEIEEKPVAMSCSYDVVSAAAFVVASALLVLLV